MKEIIEIGKKLKEEGLTYSVFGNISVRVDNFLIITKTGTVLSELKKEDLIKLPIFEKTDKDKFASVELPLHREIYKKTKARAIVHSHPIFSVIMSILCKEKYVPLDYETKRFLKEVPIVEGESGSHELALKVADALSTVNAVIIRGHGVFTVGENLKEAFFYTCMLEHSCKIYYFVKLISKIS